MIELNKIYCEDCLETLKRIPDNFVDSIITDPPYGIGFMGKEWDNFKPSFIEKKTTDHLPIDHKLQSGRSASMHAGLYDLSITGLKKYQAWCYDWAKECLRVLKPGGHLLAFGGTRTYHRMACAIEDAGFEIRDQIQWLYGSGFPKSLSISKAMDKKKDGIEHFSKIEEIRNFLASHIGKQNKKELAILCNVTTRQIDHWIKENESQPQIPSFEKWKILEKYFQLKERPNVPKINWENLGKIVAEVEAPITWYSGDKYIRKPSTPEAQQWEGWGTALKPANEPICMARKPLSEKTVAENILKWGTGGINVDATRIGNIRNYKRHGGGSSEIFPERDNKSEYSKGRWPANVIHDGSEEVLREFPNSNTKRIEKSSDCSTNGITSFDNMRGNRPSRGYDGSGSAARFFYCAKASKAERDAGLFGMEYKDTALNFGGELNGNGKEINIYPRRNNHPTVKPIALMRYLCRLITPPKGTIYDPFIGSGTTGIAAGLEDFNFIGSEIEKESCRIAEKRIAFHRAQLKLQYD